MSLKVEKITDPSLMGEGPHWDDRQQCLYYVSIKDNTLNKYVPATGDHTKTKLDGHVGFIIPVDGASDQFVIGLERKFLVVQWDGQEGSKVNVVRELGEVDQDVPTNRLNDAKADPRGRLFGGTTSQDSPPGNYSLHGSSLYRIDSEKGCKIEKVISNVSVSNGLAWDLKRKAFYYIDSMERKIRRYDYDVDTGEISNLKYVCDLETHNQEGLSDGMTIDTDGNLWVAMYGGASVLKINPESGEILLKVPIPASYVTSVTFGGPKFDILFVTTASTSVAEPQPPPNGSTFMIFDLGVEGFLNNNFKL